MSESQDRELSVLYRAIWSDIVTSDVEAGVQKFLQIASEWAQEVPGSTLLLEGRTALDLSQGRHRIVSYRAVGPMAFEVIVNDQKPGDETDWTTIIQIVADGSVVRSLIENRMESADLTRRVSIGRPRVVHNLLAAAVKPCLGGSALLTKPEPIPAGGIGILTEKLADSDRSLPVIVCSEPWGSHDGGWLDVANKIAKRVEGVAIVVTLDYDAVAVFKESLGPLAIWGGGLRVYTPVPVLPGSEGWRHRFYLRDRLQSAPQATIDRVVYSVAQLSGRRRVPDAFDIFSDLSESPGPSLIPITELEDAREQWEFDYDLALEERSEVEKELAKAHGHLARLKDELIARDLSELLWGTIHEDMDSVPDEVQDTSEAVLAAQTYLGDRLVVPTSAPRELEDIDTAPEAYSWGNTAWRGLRALAAYAEDRAKGWDKGGFWEWCASGPVLGWPATSKKLSMSEGQGVQTNDKLSRTRVFEVDRAVAASGSMTMLAHLKIAEGGGNLAPRIYFHDDSGGATGKVHVGLIGPHYLVPNKSTN